MNRAESLAQWMCWVRTHRLRAEKACDVVSGLGEGGTALTQHPAKEGRASAEELARLLQEPEGGVLVGIEQKVNTPARRIMEQDLLTLRECWLDPQKRQALRDRGEIRSFLRMSSSRAVIRLKGRAEKMWRE